MTIITAKIIGFHYYFLIYAGMFFTSLLVLGAGFKILHWFKKMFYK